MADNNTRPGNYDESKVPHYTLQDPLESVSSPQDWPKRRSEIYQQFEEEMFGKAPTFDKTKLEVRKDRNDVEFMGGQGVLCQPLLLVAGCEIQLCMILPKSDKPVPVFVGYNFHGNHSIHPEKSIALAKGWVFRVENNTASDDQRGFKSSRWPLEEIIQRGYGVVTMYAGDVDPDFHDEWKNGVHGAYPTPGPGEWGTIAAWSWGLSRVMDYLESNEQVDEKRVAAIGHSRLGKTSLWAGASDKRFSMVISNNSGCGGAALSKRCFGETVERVNTRFPHWFNGNFQKYSDNEEKLPFDQHMLLSLIAPRPLYVASAEEDLWADPHGEFLSVLAADPVYRLLGTEEFPVKKIPQVDEPVVASRRGYHIRTGKHDITAYDW
eukprot:CAMPEP_0201520598 /NCGR_PEP_ID=MMETSP0161_2-20130828/11969_1 /ASSEMBLY_ACC=CAM_ASM_000251 /TAXON_ID=180227 /ORGANISM="Neoparamoeba aestuarina, Strain SoJaBio B1-5/56/2" /LENGTH=378 /DNA_ID=CAMNT_0047919027 /DNA_START=78 /DNA_END=1211 /DNA_ORIENTATION=+